MKELSLERSESIRERLAAQAPKGKRRQVAKAIGVSNTALGDFIDKRTGPPLEETLDRYEAWLNGRSDRSDEGSATPTEYDRHLKWLRDQEGTLETKTAHLREVRGGFRDESLRLLAVAVLRAEENAALLSQERSGHREAIVRGNEDSSVTPSVVRSVLGAHETEGARHLAAKGHRSKSGAGKPARTGGT